MSGASGELRDRRAIVTGASRGIGEAVAETLAGLGVRVLLLARDVDAAGAVASRIRDAGGDAQAMRCDVARYEDVAAGVERCTALFGGVDMLINNAGLIEPIGQLGDLDPGDWGRIIDVNVKGVFNGVHAVLPGMLAAGGGVIVNLSSGAATSVLEGWSHYCASKHAVLAITRSVHLEYAARGIRCLGLVPGTVATHMQVAIRRSGINPVSELDPKRHVPPSHAAKAVAWLCSDAARDLAGEDVSLKLPEMRRRMGLEGV